MNLTDLRQLGNLLVAESEQAMTSASGFALKPPEMMVMAELYAHGTLSVGTLARHVGLAQSRVSTAVAALRRERLVSVEPAPDDGRKTMVRLGERAEEVADVVRHQDARPLVASLAGELAPDQLDELLVRLSELRDALDRRARTAGSAR